MKIASLNIAGGRPFKSIGGRSESLREEYQEEDVNYFIQVLAQANPDITVLQEVHTPILSGEPNQATTIAVGLHMQSAPPHAYGNSHITDGQRLSLLNLSKLPLEQTYFHPLPNPGLTVARPNGQNWITQDTGFLVSRMDYEGEKITVVNGHIFPLHYFNTDYLSPDPRIEAIRVDMANFFESLLDQPTIIAADFNYGALEAVIPQVYGSGKYTEAFSEPTTPKGIQQDHILLSPHWELVTSEVKKIQADHYLCAAELNLS